MLKRWFGKSLTLLACMLCFGLPAWADRDLDAMNEFNRLMQAGKGREAMSLLIAEPGAADLWFSGLESMYLMAKTNPVFQKDKAYQMNVVARAYEKYLNDPRFTQRLDKLNIRLPKSAWDDTMLDDQDPMVKPAPFAKKAPDAGERSLVALALQMLAGQVGNYRDAFLNAQVNEKYWHTSQQMLKDLREVQAFVGSKSSGEQLRTLTVLTSQAQQAAIHWAAGLHSQAIKEAEEVAEPLARVLKELAALHKDSTVSNYWPLYVELILTMAGREEGDLELRDRHLARARALLGPEDHLDRFLIESLEAEQQRLGEAELAARHDKVWAHLAKVDSVSRNVLYLRWTFAMGKFWMEQTNRREADLAALTRLGKMADLKAVVALLQREGDLSNDELQIAIASASPEAALCLYDLYLDEVEGLREAGKAAEAAQRLASLDRELTSLYQDFEAADGPLRKRLEPFKLECSLVDSDIARLLGRCAEEKGRQDQSTRSSLFAQAVQRYQQGQDLRAAALLGPEAEMAAYRIERDARTRSQLDGWLKQSSQMGFRAGQVASLTSRAELNEEQGDQNAALADLGQAVEITERFINETRASGASAERFRRRAGRAYRMLARVQLETGQGDEAMKTMDRLQQVEVRDLDPTLVNYRNPEINRAVQQLGLLKRRAGTLELEAARLQGLPDTAQLRTSRKVNELARTQASQSFLQLTDQIRGKSPEAFARLAISPRDMARQMRFVPEGAAVIMLVPAEKPGQKPYLAVGMARDKEIHYVQAGATMAEMETAVKQFTEQVEVYKESYSRGLAASFHWQDASAASLKQPLLALNKAIYEPIDALVKDQQVLVFIPYGPLTYLPFAALARPKSDGGLDFLVTRKQVVTCLSLADLVSVTLTPPAPARTLLAFGDPAGDLKAASVEVKAIQPMFTASKVYLGPEARQEKLSSESGYSYLHLATHGTLVQARPEASYLTMAGSKLRVTDIEKLDFLGVRLVTLSACQSGLGAANPGREFASLAQAFKDANSKAIMATLWQVDDRVTGKFMVTFYQALRDGASKSLALQKAQTQVLEDKELTHPFFWAPYFLSGDWR